MIDQGLYCVRFAAFWADFASAPIIPGFLNITKL